MSDESLYRPESLKRVKHDGLGEIILIRPMSFAVLTLLAVLMAFIALSFLFFGSYTKRSTLSGHLVPATGQFKVHAPQAGIVLEKFVQEGQVVSRGERLMIISSERYGSDSTPVQASISRKMEQRRDSLLNELIKLQQLQLDERATLSSKVVSLQGELSILNGQVQTQRNLIALASDAVERYQGLLEKGYISVDQLQQRQTELLGQRQTMQRLEREHTSLQQEHTERRNEFQGIAARQTNQLAELQRMLMSVEQELAESEAKRSAVITAPEPGIATAVLAEVGQTIDSSRPLLSIVPINLPLQAELYAPSKSIGFIRPGDKVLIRYQAYPYQKFGQHHGIVKSISRTSLPLNELPTIPGANSSLIANGEQVYRLKVDLDKQAVTAYGQPHLLQSGMLLDADVLLDTRRLYEWVLEPLYSLTGKF